ncbi:hypothetical protein BDF14DRAFT_1789430 [Spinellus fusiger]|nr:hypothetical protein BDF14DRAFT_1789430 [Spinellus fusiger]
MNASDNLPASDRSSPKKRKHSSASSTEASKSVKGSDTDRIAIPQGTFSPPLTSSLPLLSVVPSPYYPVYCPQPLYLSVTTAGHTQPRFERILPKTSQTPASVNYAHVISPQLHPTLAPTPVAAPQRHNSISSLSTADQREQARKVSHSAIERRRRERINDKILQLKQLIPSCAEQSQLHKMGVLQSAIDYITYLKEIVESIDGDQVRVQGKHLQIKTHKPLLPEEVKPFTHQFSSTQDILPESTTSPEDDAWSVDSSSPYFSSTPTTSHPPALSILSPNSTHLAAPLPHTSLPSPTEPVSMKRLKPSDVIRAKTSSLAATDPPPLTLSSPPMKEDKQVVWKLSGLVQNNMSLEHLLC